MRFAAPVPGASLTTSSGTEPVGWVEERNPTTDSRGFRCAQPSLCSPIQMPL